MRHLLRLFAWRHGRRHPLRAALGGASVALGVALFVSADVSNNTVLRAFERTSDKLAGKARLQATFAHGGGIDEAAIARIEKIPGTLAAPVLLRSATTELTTDPVLVFGIDFKRDRQLRVFGIDAPGNVEDFLATAFLPGGVIVTRPFAERHKLQKGSTFDINADPGRTKLTVTGLMDAEGPAGVFGGNLLLMSLPAAQRLFARPGIVDRLDIAPPEGTDVGEFAARLRAELGPDYSVDPVRRSNAILEDALSRVRALVIVSVVALIVGVFIIYNSVSIAVVERFRDVAILRSVGATRRQILWTVMVEWGIVGLAGSAAGVVGGVLLAEALVRLAADSANTLTLAIDVTQTAFSWGSAVGATAAGTLVSLVAAWVPAREATTVAPAGLMGTTLPRTRAVPRYLRSFIVGALLTAAGAVLVVFFYLSLPAYGGLVAATLVFVGVALAMPQLTLWMSRAARPMLRRVTGVTGWLAADGAAKFPQRTALTTVALGGALSMMVASATFVTSLRASADAWLVEALPFDLSVNGTDLSRQIYSPARFPESLADEVASVEGVKSLYTVSVHYQPYRGSEVMLLGFDLDPLFAMHEERGLTPRVARMGDPEVRRALKDGTGVIVSENFAFRYGKPEGSMVELATADGPRSFRVMAAVQEYSWPSGTVVLSRDAYKRLWRDDRIAYIDLKVAPGHTIEEVRGRVAERLKGTRTVHLYDTAELRRIGGAALDQAFALANVQVLIAVLIGFLGILNTLLISVLRRTREIGLLRAVGATRSQVGRTVVLEALLLAVAGGAMGAGAGLLGAALPLRLHTLQVTGYWLPLTIPWGMVALAPLAAVAIGAIASILPARRAARLNVLDAIAYE